MDTATEVDPTALDEALARFLAETQFAQHGAVMTDLDGTAVHEHQGRVVIPKSVSRGLTELRLVGRPIVLNTLRFPLNVIRTFGREWYAISNAPLPLVSLNGSMVGYLHETSNGAIEFEEAWASPVPAATCEAVLGDLETLLANGLDDVIIFYYLRDWTAGERLWTPMPDRRSELRAQYPSASVVDSEPLERLGATLQAGEPCMLLVLVNAGHDELMAYQHVRPQQFVTAQGVDKAAGAVAAARLLDVDLAASVGAGDTVMDAFLAEVGLAVHVGAGNVPYPGRHSTVNVADSLALGELWFRLADHLRRSTA